MSTTADIAQTIADNLADATPEVIENIKRAKISDGAKLAMLYFADAEFREIIQDQVAKALVAKAAA